MATVTPTYGAVPLITVPSPPVPSTTPTVASIAVDAVSTIIQAGTISTGFLAADLTPVVNDHAARLEVVSQAINGVPAIIRGLALSGDTTSLVLTISGGQAFTPAFREVSGVTMAMSASVINWVWLEPTGSFSAGVSGYIPSDGGCFLGAVTCDAVGITTIDPSGVMSIGGGLPVRIGNDVFKPTDSPSITAVHLVKTSNSTWLWDGARYCLLENRKGTVALVDAAAIATDAALGEVFTVTLAGNRTLSAPTNFRDGQRCLWMLKQDATGSRTLTLDSVFKVPTGITVTLSTTAAKVDLLEAVYSSFVSGWIVTNFQKGF